MRFTSALVVLLELAMIGAAYALPVERFEGELDMTCAGDKSCEGSVRSSGSVGQYLTLALKNRPKGQTRVAIGLVEGRGRLQIRGRGSSWGELVLTWDGDSRPSQLSSAGLGCIDLSSDGATALVLRALRINASCDGGADSKGCAPIIFSVRIFDANDPSGQRYSTAYIRRALGRSGRDLVIPLSAFSNEGPNGPGNLTCTGAIEMTVTVEEGGDLSLVAEALETNAQKATPTPTPTPTFTPSATSTPTPTLTPTSSPTVAATATTPASSTVTSTATPTIRPSNTATATATSVPTKSASLLAAPIVTPTVRPTLATVEVPTQEAAAPASRILKNLDIENGDIENRGTERSGKDTSDSLYNRDPASSTVPTFQATSTPKAEPSAPVAPEVATSEAVYGQVVRPSRARSLPVATPTP